MNMMKTQDLYTANNYRHACVPKTLYKFYPANIINKRMQGLRKKTIWLSPVSAFNDPFEFLAFYYPNSGDNIQERIKRDLSHNFLVASLSTQSYQCPIMWAHYGGNHMGFCVEYEIINPRWVWNVYYSDKRLPYENGFLKMLRNVDDGQPDCIGMGMFIQQLAYKSKEWEYEQEYRIIFPTEIESEISEKECGKLYTLDTVGLKMKAIYAGWKASDSLITKLIKSARMIDCDFYNIALSSKKFEMEILTDESHEI